MLGLISLSCSPNLSKLQQGALVYQQTLPSVVMVKGEVMNNWRGSEIQGIGTGFFINKEYVLTNHHIASIIADGTIKLRLWNGEMISAKKIALDEKYDLALLQVDVEDTRFYDLPELNLETIPQIGDEVYIIGSPRLYYNTMTKGILSRKSTTGNSAGWLWNCKIYFVDAPIQGGNSGSPVLDIDSGVIGIVSGMGGNLTIVIPSYSILSFLKEQGI